MEQAVQLTGSLTIFVPKLATAGVIAANAADLVLCPGDNIAFDIASTNPGTLDASSSAGSVISGNSVMLLLVMYGLL